MRVLIGIQARTSSNRLPRKIYETIGNKSLLEWIYAAGTEAERMARAKGIECLTYVLGPAGDSDLEKFCASKLIKVYQPPFAPTDDLIHRYKAAARHFECNYILRLTADCWRMDARLVDEGIQLLSKFDYVSNTIHRTFAEGLDFQGCSLKALEWFDHTQKESREHPFKDFDANEKDRKAFEKAGFKYTELLDPRAIWTIRTSIDTKEDLELARRIYEQETTHRSQLDREKQECPRAGLSGNELETMESIR